MLFTYRVFFVLDTVNWLNEVAFHLVELLSPTENGALIRAYRFHFSVEFKNFQSKTTDCTEVAVK